MLLELMLEFHAWSTARPAQESDSTADALEKEIAADPQAVTVLVAEAGGELVSAGWVRYVAGTGFATLWGGSTLPQWRRRGIYKALVIHRARLAAHVLDE